MHSHYVKAVVGGPAGPAAMAGPLFLPKMGLAVPIFFYFFRPFCGSVVKSR